MIKKVFFLYVCMISILAFSVNNAGVDIIKSDKINHILAFCLFSILYISSFGRYVYSLIWGVVFGIFIEVVQYFLPYRDSDLWDLFADVEGLLIGVTLFYILDYFYLKSKWSKDE